LLRDLLYLLIVEKDKIVKTCSSSRVYIFVWHVRRKNVEISFQNVTIWSFILLVCPCPCWPRL